MNSSKLNYFARKEQKFAFFQGSRGGLFSIFRWAAAGSDGPCRCSSTSPPYFNPSPYTNNSQLLLSPTSPFPSHHSIPNIAPSQLPFHYAILTHPPLSPPSHPLSAYRFHQIHSRTTSSIGVFFIPFLFRFSSIVEHSYPFRSDSLSFIPCQYCFLWLRLLCRGVFFFSVVYLYLRSSHLTTRRSGGS